MTSLLLRTALGQHHQTVKKGKKNMENIFFTLFSFLGKSKTRRMEVKKEGMGKGKFLVKVFTAGKKVVRR